MRNYYLIFWEEIPESSCYYLIPSEEILNQFSSNEIKSLHHKFINDSYSEDISNLLEKLSIILEKDWNQFKIETAITFDSDQRIEMVITTGFIL